MGAKRPEQDNHVRYHAGGRGETTEMTDQASGQVGHDTVPKLLEHNCKEMSNSEMTTFF